MKIKTLPFVIISLVMAVILVPFSWNAFKTMKLDTSIDKVMGTDGQSQETFQKFNKAFKDNTTVIAIIKIDNLFSQKGTQTLYEISETLQTMPNFNDIKSLTHSTRPIKGDIGFNTSFKNWLKFKPFLDTSPKTAEQWLALKKFNTNYPLTKGILISPNGQYCTVIAVLNGQVDTIEEKTAVMTKAQAAVKPFIDQGIEIKFLSEAFVAVENYSLLQNFLLQFIFLSLGLMALVIYVSFRSWRILFLILTYQACGFLVFPLVFQFNVSGTNIFTAIVIPLCSAIQLTFLTHFYSVFQNQSLHFSTLPCVLKKTLGIVFKPSLTALITSLIGMGALCLSEVEVLTSVGLIGLQSLTLIFIITFLPAILLSLKAKKEIGSTPSTTPNTSSLAESLFKKRYPAAIVSILLIGSSLFSYQFISPDIRAEEFLPPASETRQAIELIDRHFGGVAILQLKVTTDKENGIQEYKTIQYLSKLREDALKLKGVENIYTYSQFYSVLHQAITADELSIDESLPNQATTDFYSKVLNTFEIPFREVLQSEQRRGTVFFMRSRHMPTKEYMETISEFKELTKKNKPPGVQVQVSKGIHTILESNRKIVDSQLLSTGSSLLCIFISLLIMTRSGKLASAAIICNLVPLATIVLLMALGNIPLNSITVMTSAIILGISIDDSIHFLSFYKHKLNECQCTKKAIAHTLRHKIKPMICTSLVLTVCFFLFLLAPFPPINQFGILGGCALIAGLLSSCLLLPCLLFLSKNNHS